MATPDWTAKAACRDVDPELFFPISTVGPLQTQVEAAKQVCRSCPAINQCLEWALTSDERWGVWGGTSEEERRRMSRANMAGIGAA